MDNAVKVVLAGANSSVVAARVLGLPENSPPNITNAKEKPKRNARHNSHQVGVINEDKHKRHAYKSVEIGMAIMELRTKRRAAVVRATRAAAAPLTVPAAVTAAE